MSSPDRPCAQGFGTMRRLRRMRFPLGIDQDSAKNCHSRDIIIRINHKRFSENSLLDFERRLYEI